jgi:hypothetical protein
MSTLVEHIRVLRSLAAQSAETTMLQLAMIGAMEELAEAIEGLAIAVAQLRSERR